MEAELTKKEKTEKAEKEAGTENIAGAFGTNVGAEGSGTNDAGGTGNGGAAMAKGDCYWHQQQY